MSAWNDPPERDEEPVVIDVYGIKAQLRPGDLGEPMPRSWADVKEQIRGHLLRLAVAPTRLIVELFEGVTRLIRGTSYVPEATASRIRRAHIRADHQERQAEAEAVAPAQLTSASEPDPPAHLSPSGSAELVDRLDGILQRIRAQGRDGAVVLMQNGGILVVAGTPEEMRGQIEAAADEVLRLGGATTVGQAEYGSEEGSPAPADGAAFQPRGNE